MIYSCRHKETNSSSELTTAQIIARLDRAGIANTQMNEMADLWGHVQFEARRPHPGPGRAFGRAAGRTRLLGGGHRQIAAGTGDLTMPPATIL